MANLENLRYLRHEVKWLFHYNILLRVVFCLREERFHAQCFVDTWVGKPSGLTGCFNARWVEGLEWFKESAWSVTFGMFQSKLIDILWPLSRGYIQDSSSHKIKFMAVN